MPGPNLITSQQDSTQLRHVFELNRRLFVCLRVFNFSMVGWLCTVILLESRRPISESSLALASEVSRTTVRHFTVWLIDMGLADRTNRGIVLTYQSRMFFGDLVQETVMISTGKRVGYSPSISLRILMMMRKDKRRATASRLPKIGFPYEIVVGAVTGCPLR